MQDQAMQELMTEIEIIEAQPLAERAKSFETIYERLQAELKRSDRSDFNNISDQSEVGDSNDHAHQT